MCRGERGVSEMSRRRSVEAATARRDNRHHSAAGADGRRLPTWFGARHQDPHSKSPRTGHSPSEYRSIQWPPEVLIEGWCSPNRETRTRIEDDWDNCLTLCSFCIAWDPRRGDRKPDAVQFNRTRWMRGSTLEPSFHRRMFEVPIVELGPSLRMRLGDWFGPFRLFLGVLWLLWGRLRARSARC